VSFKYRLTYTDGDDGGDFETAVSDWKVGDTFHTAEGRRLRIVQIIPEFELGPDEPTCLGTTSSNQPRTGELVRRAVRRDTCIAPGR
jgi:hypothetical protein